MPNSFDDSNMETSIVPITSTTHARALARVKAAAFQNGPLFSSMFPVELQLIEDWLAARETAELQDPTQTTFAVVKEVMGESGSGYSDPASHITFPTGEDNGAQTKRYVITAWARWFHLSPRDEPAKNGEDATASTAAAMKEKKQDLILSPNNLPKGTNLALNAAFREGMVEGRKKYVEDGKDCVLEQLCTNPQNERQGHGGRLLKWGLQLADDANKRVYLEATQTAVPLYARMGWKVVETFEWTLEDYGVKGDGDGGGTLKLTAMMREPRGK